MRKQLLNLKFLLMLCMIFGIGGGSVAFAEETTVTSTFTDKNWSVGTGEPTWTSTGAAQQGFEAKGVQTTLSNINTSGLSLTNTTIKNLGNITSVSLVVSSNGTGGSISSVKVGETSLKCGTSTSYTVSKTSGQTATFKTSENVTGDIVISFASTATSKSLYVKSISVTYTTGGGSTAPTTNTLTITPGTSTFTKATDITMSATIDGTKIYYTTDGKEPSESSTLYDGAFKVTQTGTTVKAVAIADGYDNVTAEATYTIKPDQPIFSEQTKMFKDAFDVTLSLPETTDETSTIHYAIGSNATAESDMYTGAINISSETDGEKIILHAVVVDEYGNVGTERYCTYTKTTATIFDFTQRPNVWNIEPTSNNSSTSVSNVVGKELAVDGIVMTSTSGSGSITCIYASSTNEPNLRVYNGGSITFTAPEGYNLSEIKFDGSKLNLFASTADTYTTSNSTWTGNAHAVTFTASGGVQVKTASIKMESVSATPVTGTLTLVAQNSDGYYATFSSDKDVVFTADDVIVYAISVADNKMKWTPLPSTENYAVTDATAGTVKGYYVPKNNGVLISCLEASAKYYFPKTEDGTVTIKNNNLKAAPAAGGVLTPEEGDYKYYKLAYDDYDKKTGLGFYWGAENGGAFSVKAGSAYLAVPTSVANVKGFSFDGTTTGISAVGAEGTAKTNEIYNIAGQRVNAMTKAGLYIVNGKKMVIKK